MADIVTEAKSDSSTVENQHGYNRYIGLTRQLGTISITVSDLGRAPADNLEEACVPEADQFVAEGTQAIPSTPFVSRMGSSIFESLRFRTSIVPPWGQVT
jgi:hypothetical protein